MTTYKISKHTADEYRAMAQSRRDAEAESFDRCDTDGFLSQWAWRCLESTYLSLARLADKGDEGGDIQEVAWPFKLDGDTWRPVEEFSLVSGDYRESARIYDAGKVTWWNFSQARKAATAQRNDEKKGIRWGLVKARGVARTYNTGSGAYFVPEELVAPVSDVNYSDVD